MLEYCQVSFPAARGTSTRGTVVVADHVHDSSRLHPTVGGCELPGVLLVYLVYRRFTVVVRSILPANPRWWVSATR